MKNAATIQSAHRYKACGLANPLQTPGMGIVGQRVQEPISLLIGEVDRLQTPADSVSVEALAGQRAQEPGFLAGARFA